MSWKNPLEATEPRLVQSLPEEEKIVVVDPDENPDGVSEKLLDELEYVDAVLNGGSKDVAPEESVSVVESIKQRYPDMPVYEEPGDKSHVSMDTLRKHDGLLASVPLNGDLEKTIDQHLDFFDEAEQKLYEKLPFAILENPITDKVAEKAVDYVVATKYFPQGFVIMNPDCDAAEKSGVKPEDIPGKTEIREYAETAEEMSSMPVFYIEYSGEYGDPDIVEAASEVLDDTHLRYGGGIESYGQVEEMLEAGADSVVVGTSLEDNGVNPFNPDLEELEESPLPYQ